MRTGFVCQPAYLANITKWTDPAGEPFPLLDTNQGWQFGWAAWYSAILPSRPVQFTSQEPNYRQSFWSFPHPSVDTTVTTDAVSSLYDSVRFISLTISVMYAHCFVLCCR